MTRRTLVSMVSATAAAAAITASIAATTWGNDAPAGAQLPSDPAAYAKVTTIQQDQAAAFSVLRRPVAAGDAINTDATGPFGANLRLARRVTADGLSAWVVPANQHICLRGMDAGYPVWSCTTEDEAAKGNLVLSLRDPATDEATAIYALVPDGSSTGTLRDNGAAGAAVAVKDNLAIKAGTDATTLSYNDKGGEAHTAPVP
jgi:hypothetical protein